MVERGEKQGVVRASDLAQVSVSPQGFPSEKNVWCATIRGFVPLFTGQLFIVARGLASAKTHVKLRERSGQACRPADGLRPGYSGKVPPILHRSSPSHDTAKPAGRESAHRARGPYLPRHHLDRLGFQLARHQISAGRAAAADAARHHRRDRREPAGAAGAVARPEPAGARELWPRLVLAAFLNVGCWMVLMGFALLWLPASEAALIAYTMPVWASILAWPILGERPNLLRVMSLLMAFAGFSAILGGNGFAASVAKLPGIIMALGGAIGFAVGTVLAKKLPLHLPPVSAAAWQIGIGCLPVAIAGFCSRSPASPDFPDVDWMLLGYSTVVQFCVAYVCWFAALARLPASVAAIGTMAVPVIGVVASALALHEPLGIGQIAALVFTLAGVALATQS